MWHYSKLIKIKLTKIQLRKSLAYPMIYVISLLSFNNNFSQKWVNCNETCVQVKKIKFPVQNL